MAVSHGEFEIRSGLTLAHGWLDHARATGIALLLALIYFLAGKIGLSMAIPPGVATPVWPPSGIALAAILLLGARAWPGIWLGSFVLNATLLAGISAPGASNSLLVAAGIATGSAVQPLFGAWLLRRAIGIRDPFARTTDVLRFAGLSGALACTVSTSVGVTCLWLGGWARWGQFGDNWVTWWLGDSVGVLILTPLLLRTQSGRPSVLSFPRLPSFTRGGGGRSNLSSGGRLSPQAPIFLEDGTEVSSLGRKESKLCLPPADTGGLNWIPATP